MGIQEVLKKGTVEKLTVENRISLEIRAVNDLLTEIAKNSSMAVYGEKEVIDAINMGAVEKLLILDTVVPTKDMINHMEIVENMKGEVIVISSQHEGGEQLKSLGGLAAILRYPLS